MDKLIRKINIDKLLDKVIKYFIDSHMLYHDSIESYYSRKEPTFMRKTKFYLTFLLLVIFNVKHGLISLYPDTLQWTLLKDGTIIFGKQANIVHAELLSLGMVTLIGKLVMAYYESRKNIKLIDIFVDWKARKPMYRMSQKHLKKITLKAFILYYVYMRIFGSIVMYICAAIVIIITQLAYLNCDYGNVIILWFWTIIIILTFNQIKYIMLSGAIIFNVPITLLNYKFDELIKKLRVSIYWNNHKDLHQVLQSYDELIGITKQLSGPYNMVIGLVYCLVPYIISICVQLMKIERDDLLFKLLRMVSIRDG